MDHICLCINPIHTCYFSVAYRVVYIIFNIIPNISIIVTFLSIFKLTHCRYNTYVLNFVTQYEHSLYHYVI